MYIIKRSNRRKEEIVRRYIKDITDLGKARISRREAIKLGFLAGSSGLLAMYGCGSSGGSSDVASGTTESTDDSKAIVITSPPNTPFQDPLPIPPVMTAVSIDPLPMNGPNLTAASGVTGFRETNRNPHQRWTDFGGASDTGPGFSGPMYESIEKAVSHDFYPAVDKVPSSTIWTFVEASTGKVGPLRIKARYGQPVIHRVHNDLPEDNGGFGINQTSTHLHNGHTPSESDGGPVDFYGPGRFKDYHYPNVRAGYASNYLTSTLNGKTVPGNVKETLSFLWFHDHRFDFTSQNVYKGLASFYTLFSDDILLDTDDETTGLRLPSGEFDIPMIFTDKVFDPNTGLLFFDLFNLDGILGDKYAVNGKIQPFLEVKRRKYRFRLLGGGPSRFYEFFLSNGDNFILIATDGNLLPNALSQKSVRGSVASRYDVVVDFSKAKIGDKIYLQNKLEQVSGRGPTGKIISPTNVVEFRVVGDGVDNSDISSGKPLLELPAILPIQNTRNFKFERKDGAWAINGQFFNPDVISEFLPQDAIENWVLESGGGWSHPVHMHHEEAQILSRNDKLPPSYEISRRDIFDIGDKVVGSEGTGKLVFFTQHRDWHGHYPLHCHNTVHEDHAMMLRFNIGDTLPEITPDIDPV